MYSYLVNYQEIHMHQQLDLGEDDLFGSPDQLVGSNLRYQMATAGLNLEMVPSGPDFPGEYPRHQSSCVEADKVQLSQKENQSTISDPVPPVPKPVILPIAPVRGRNRKDNNIGDFKPKIALYIGKQEIAAGMKKIQKDDPYEIVELLYFDGPLTSSDIRKRKNLSLSEVNHVLTALQQSNIVSRIDMDYYVTTFGRELMEGLACIMEKIENVANELRSSMAVTQETN